MYFSFANHFYNLGHYFIGFSILFVLYPMLAFPKKSGDRTERILSNYFHMVLLLILAGYFLAALQLFEFIGLFIVTALVYTYYFFHKNSPIYAREVITKIKMYFLDSLDNVQKFC